MLDEADEMLNMGFAEDVETILAGTPEDKQLALFSATMPAADPPDHQEVRARRRPRSGSSPRPRPPTNVTQRYLKVAHPQKLDALTRILEVENFDGMIVFVRTKHATEELAERLRARGFAAAAINGDVAQAQRERTIDQLRKGKLDILVATDVAARGLDVERISHVINHDIPTDTESYVHRIGRTGRAGRSGQAISFVTPRETLPARGRSRRPTAPARADEPAHGRGRQRLPGREVHRGDRPGASATHSSAIFRELVQSYEQEHDVPAADIAAAIAVLAQDGEPLFLEDMPRATCPGATRAPGAAAATWSGGGSRSASATASSRDRSSAHSPTRAA